MTDPHSGDVRIVDIAAGDPPSFNAIHRGRPIVISLDSSAMMKLCDIRRSFDWTSDLEPHIGRVGTAAARVLRSGRHREVPGRLTLSALDLD